MATDLAVVQHEVNPLAILQQAVDKGASVEQLTVLMGLAERWESNQARKAFNVAFSEFKAESITIVKNVTVKSGPLEGNKYADLFGVVDAVTPMLSKHGLSHSWKLTKDDPAWMEVTCTIRHILGYSEEVSMGAAPDTGPGRNAIQARGSAKSYLERYTLLAATGLSSANEDDDGVGTGLPEEDRKKILNSVTSAKTMADLKSAYLLSTDTAEKAKDATLVELILKAKNERAKSILAEEKRASHAKAD
jgi:hypothetical protein